MESLVNMAEELELQTQPDDDMVADSETNVDVTDVPSLDDESTTEQEGLILDVEDDQLKSSKFDTSSPEYKAFRKANEAKKRKNQIIETMMQERAETAKQMAEMQSKLAQIEKGKPPEIDDFLDEKDFEKATREYYQANPVQSPIAPQQTQITQQQAANNVLDERAEYQHFVNEQEVRKSFKDYDDTVNALKEDIHQAIQINAGNDVPFDDVVSALITTGHMANVNMGKALFAIQKIPSLKAELLNPRVLSSDIFVADVLRKAEKSIKSGRPVSSTPPPNIKQGGSIDNSSKAVQKAREQWQKTGSAADFAKLQAIKRGSR